MTSVGIVTDSTADLPRALLDRHGVTMVPLVVSWDGKTYRDKLDLTTAEFYRRLRTSKTLPKTGAPSIAAFETAFRQQLEQHEEVVCINLAAPLSSTYEVARQAAQSVAPEQIHVVDSGSVSICIAWLVELAATLAEQGQAAPAIVEQLEETRPRLRVLALVETLEFLKRGGRIGRAAALAGTLLSVKPILSIKDGEVAPLERVRTMRGALRRLVELVVSLGPVERVGVIDGDAVANTSDVAQQLKAQFSELEIERGELGPVVGTHGGPGVVGVGVLLAR
jgi:DegV family protein with EDD domain